MNRHIIIVLAIAAGAVLAAGTVTATMAQGGETVAQSVGKARKFMDYEDGVFRVMAGAGGPTAPLTKFFPETAHIKVGETVVWYNPTKVAEPHTISFIVNEVQWANFETAYVISNSTSVAPLAPGNSEPITFPAGNATAMVGANARALMPAIVAEDGSASYLAPNANYTMTGSEQYINSGFVWPEGMAPEGFADNTTFAVKFEQAGTYDYICILHPWMTGRVVVS